MKVNYYAFVICLYSYVTVVKCGYAFIKELDSVIYVGGMNMLASYRYSHEEQVLIKLQEQYYVWPENIINGSSYGYPWSSDTWPPNFQTKFPKTLSFDSCLNWKEAHPNATVRESSYDYVRYYYKWPRGDFKTMNFTCMNSFIKAVGPLDDERLWVCGTFGSFPRAFSVNKTTLGFIEFVDKSVMTCARSVDEPMVTHFDNLTKERYVGSGWGLYRADSANPDVPDNNSTMLYSDWRIYRNQFFFAAARAHVLSSDVSFIDLVKETDTHFYFFGREINSQYGYNNQEDRNAWQSFLLKICKNDFGFRFDPTSDLYRLVRTWESVYYWNVDFGTGDYQVNPSFFELRYMQNLPEKLFVTTTKVNYGCYILKRPGAIGDNHFWGETNVVYLNRLVDAIFDPNRKIKFINKQFHEKLGCKQIPHSQIPLLGLFNGAGIVGTGVEPTGALCQIQINENVFPDAGRKKPKYSAGHNMTFNPDAFAEIMTLGSMTTPDFRAKVYDRTNGITLYPWFSLGVMTGAAERVRPDFLHDFYQIPIGKCQPKSFFESMSTRTYFQILNFTNLAWPNDMPSKFTSLGQIVCQYAAAEIIGSNASFVVSGVEFKRMFIIADNITDYVMHKFSNEEDFQVKSRKFTSPLMIVAIISTSGVLYRIVVCDFNNGITNDGFNKSSGMWYDWCIFRRTDQPYLYRQFIPMEVHRDGDERLFRASSLLSEKKVVTASDSSSFPINRDPQFHVVKGVLEKGDFLHVVTTSNIHRIPKNINCFDYGTCINCASDPFCMWKISDRLCVKYSPLIYQDDKYVQDVLDRGYRCLTCIKKEKNIEIASKNRRVFNCSNSGFWRGDILWKRNNKRIPKSNIYFDIKDNFLYVRDDLPASLDNISCHGINNDHDRLYLDQEYEWITVQGIPNNILLNLYSIDKSREFCGYACAVILIVTLVLSLLTVFGLAGFILYTNREILLPLILPAKFKADSPADIPLTSETFLDKPLFDNLTPKIRG